MIGQEQGGRLPALELAVDFAFPMFSRHKGGILLVVRGGGGGVAQYDMLHAKRKRAFVVVCAFLHVHPAVVRRC